MPYEIRKDYFPYSLRSPSVLFVGRQRSVVHSKKQFPSSTDTYVRFFFVSGSIPALASRSDQVKPSVTIAERSRHGLRMVYGWFTSEINDSSRTGLFFAPRIATKNANLIMHFVANTVCPISLPKLIGAHKLCNEERIYIFQPKLAVTRREALGARSSVA